MRIAFYAPLKPPDHPVASGDRSMARALIAALELGGHEVTLVSHFRSYDSGDARRQARLREEGRKIAHRYLRKIERSAARPELWFTYHLYHKAPDWLGPVVTQRLGIPYVIAEASFAPKQKGGHWDLGHRAVGDAIRAAALILQPNPVDTECVLPLLEEPERMVPLRPFIDTAPFRVPARRESRAAIGEKLRLEGTQPWLLSVAMMRDDQKLLSYRVLTEALDGIADRPWQIIIAGAGPAKNKVRTLFAPLGERVRFAGVLDPDELKRLYRAADLYVWPAIKEAFGIAPLEAQAAGLPVVAGRSGGIASVVSDNQTGLLVPEGDTLAFAQAVDSLLADPKRRAAMGRAAEEHAIRENDIAGAAALLTPTSAASPWPHDPDPRRPAWVDRLERGRSDPGSLGPPAFGAGARADPGARLRREWIGAQCLSSPLKRAMQTATLLGLSPKAEPRLIEMAWGEWEGQSLQTLREKLGAAMAENEALGLDFRPPGGESPRDVQARLRPLLAKLGEPTILITHKGVLRALYALATNWTMTGKPPHKLLEGCAHAFEVAGDGTPSVVDLNIPLAPRS